MAILLALATAACSGGLRPGQLVAQGAIPFGSYPLGPFTLTLKGKTAADAAFSLQRTGESNVVWSTIPGAAFFAGASGKAHIREAIGSFFVKDRISRRCPDQTVTAVRTSTRQVTILGRVLCKDGGRVGYRAVLRALSDRRVAFEFRFDDEKLNRAYVTYASGADEAIFGFGEQFTRMNLKGSRLPILVAEQGVGRGAQPITFLANLLKDAGGDWHTSYAPVPHYITSDLRSLFLENHEYSVFNMQAEDRITIEVFSHSVRGSLFRGDSPLELIQSYTAVTGRMRKLPDWILSGAVIGMQGGTARVREIWNRLRKEKAPIAAFWLQDWSGQRKTSFGKQLWWNWELDHQRYSNWQGLQRDFGRDNIRVMTYINPFLADAAPKAGHRRNMYREAEKRGYVIKGPDGKTLVLKHVGFDVIMLDLSNPAARTWIKGIIKKEMIATGASGWMADFGEGLPFESKLLRGDPLQYHNRYPEEWARVNREAIREAGREKDIVYFMRAGYTRSPRYNTLFWLGDQLVTWDQYDGLKSAVTGMLSSGISGYAFNHSDIGGYTTLSNPLLNYHRSRELQMRWAEMSAFSVVYRTHEGNRPDANHQFHSDAETLKHFVRMARIYSALAPYRKRLVAEAARTGAPVVRHPFLHFWAEHELRKISYQQFMLGPELMIAPVTDPGTDKVRVFLPKGTSWRNLWTGQYYNARRLGGYYVEIAAPLGKPVVLYPVRSKVGAALRARLKQEGLLSP